MDRWLIDTDILIDYARRHQPATAFLDSARGKGQPLLVSIITAMELLIGCRNRREVDGIEELLARFEVCFLDAVSSQRAYELIRQFSTSHGLLVPDALIASTAQAEGLTLVTRNTRHFSMIEALPLHQPY